MPKPHANVKRRERTKELSVANRFTPKFWEDMDGRYGIAKEVRRRYEQLRDDTGADRSMQRDMLCQRATFLAMRLETMECEATEGKPVDWGVYTQGINTLSGLLKTLGLDRPMRDGDDLAAYLKERAG